MWSTNPSWLPTLSVTETDTNQTVSVGGVAGFDVHAQWAASSWGTSGQGPWLPLVLNMTVYYDTVDPSGSAPADYESTDGPQPVTFGTPSYNATTGMYTAEATIQIQTIAGPDDGATNTVTVELTNPCLCQLAGGGMTDDAAPGGGGGGSGGGTGGGSGGGSQATATIAFPAPVFQNTANDGDYDVSINDGSAKNLAVNAVLATCSDGAAVTYAITGGNAAGLFAVGAKSGTITLANNLQDAEYDQKSIQNGVKGPSLGGASEYDIVVTASRANGQQTSCTEVVTINPIVVITGNTVGVRQPPGGYTNGITLDLVRLTTGAGLNQALTVKYYVSWSGATPAANADALLDLFNPQSLVSDPVNARGAVQTISIPAGQTSWEISLTPMPINPQSPRPACVGFAVYVMATNSAQPFAGAGYITVGAAQCYGKYDASGNWTWDTTGQSGGWMGSSLANVQIVNKVTLFAGATRPRATATRKRATSGNAMSCRAGAAIAGWRRPWRRWRTPGRRWRTPGRRLSTGSSRTTATARVP